MGALDAVQARKLYASTIFILFDDETRLRNVIGAQEKLTNRNRSPLISFLLPRNAWVRFPFLFVPWRKETEARSGNICDGFGSISVFRSNHTSRMKSQAPKGLGM